MVCVGRSKRFAQCHLVLITRMCVRVCLCASSGYAALLGIGGVVVACFASRMGSGTPPFPRLNLIKIVLSHDRCLGS
jgi:hypothetical protein